MMNIFERRRHEGRDASLHVDGAAAVEGAVADLARKRRYGPSCLVARRHDVGVAGKREMRTAGAESRVKVVDVWRAGLGKYQPVAGEARRLEDVLQKRQGAAFVRRDAFAANEGLRQRDGIGRDECHHALGLL